MGLANPTSGSALFGDHWYHDLERPQRTVGAILEPNAHPGRSGRNHLRVCAATAGVNDGRVDHLLDLVGLSAAGRRRVGSYSLGMRQRLGLAEALLGDPLYLILDEPANGLDPEGIRWLREFLRSFAAQGRVVLVSSHQLREVQATADDLVVIDRGRLLASAATTDLDVAKPTCRVRVLDWPAAEAALAAAQLPFTRLSDPAGRLLRVEAGDPGRVGLCLFEARVAVLELSREQRDLEEQFFSMLEAAR